MRTTVDGAGRVVVPKAYRDRLGLLPGQEIQLEETAVGLLLTPVVDGARIIETPEGPVIAPAGENQGDYVLTDEMVRSLLEAGRR